MSQIERTPEILAHVRSADGLGLQLRRDFRGVLEVPGLETVLVSIHQGTPTQLTCRRDGVSFRGTAVHGDIDIIPARTPARWEIQDEQDTALLLSLPQELLATVANEAGLLADRLEIRNRFQIRDQELEILVGAMKREMDLGFPSGRVYLNGLGLALASRLLACHSSLNPSLPKGTDGLSGHRLKRVLSFIEERLGEDLSLHQIATVAGMSASHLKELFRKSTGVSVHQYVIRRRVELAKGLLTDDNLSMAEIALAAGFAHQSHMARHMKRLLGLPPLAVKRFLAERPDSL